MIKNTYSFAKSRLRLGLLQLLCNFNYSLRPTPTCSLERIASYSSPSSQAALSPIVSQHS